MRRFALLLALSLSAHGCVLLAAEEQMAQMDAACVISGGVAGGADADPYVVVVLHHGARGDGTPPVAVDHVVTTGDGEWFFALEPGRFSVLAFRDTDRDLRIGDDQAVHHVDGGTPIECPAAAHFAGITIDVADDPRLDRFDMAALNLDRSHPVARSALPAFSLGQFTSFGEVTALDAPRFAAEVAGRSMWRPVDFVLAGNAGVYFHEPYDPDRIPVLFIHGINGSPRVFADVIENLDTDRFQPWFYYYPSGFPLQAAAGHLAQIMEELEIAHRVDTLHVVAHSMGGLVGYAYLEERARRGSPATVHRFITLATPWGGHAAAQRGLDYSPVVLPVWRDMAPGSAFLGRMFADDHPVVANGATDLHLLFSYRNDRRRSGVAGDGVATLTSMLRPEAQRQARTVLGIDDTHVGILSNDHALDMINELLHAAPADHVAADGD